MWGERRGVRDRGERRGARDDGGGVLRNVGVEQEIWVV